MKKVLTMVIGTLVLGVSVGWFIGSSNPQTPAGYVGYLTQGAVFGKAKFYGLQMGPSSPGRTWLLSTTNVSITPYTYSEDFTEHESVLSKDNLKIGFRVHIVWKVRTERVKEFVEKYSTLTVEEKNPNEVVEIAYKNFLREPLRTYARDEIQKLDGLVIKDSITPIGGMIFERVNVLTKDTPFEVTSVVVGNIQYPKEVADAVGEKMAFTQILERKKTEVQIEKAEKEKRIVQAEGIAKAMEIIQVKLTPQYLQHEAIEAQKMMVGSPNHTTIYIPVGPMGVPLVGTVNTLQEGRQAQ